MNQTTNYELSLYEGTDLFNPLTVENVNFSDLDTIIKGVSDRAPSGATELLTGTVHAITRTDTDCPIFVFTATANYTAGETFTVDGTQVTALLPSGTTLPTGAYVIGSNVMCLLNGTLMTVLCDAGADAQTLQGHAASYFATDSDLDNLTTTVGNISAKVGSAVLTTTAPDCSGAINELNSNLAKTYGGSDVATALTSSPYRQKSIALPSAYSSLGASGYSVVVTPTSDDAVAGGDRWFINKGTGTFTVTQRNSNVVSGTSPFDYVVIIH